MEKDEMVYNEYTRIIARRDALLDSSFRDIRLYGIIGSFFVITGTIKNMGVKINSVIASEAVYFIILLLLFFLITIIAYRDLIKQTYIVHLDYNIKKFEEHLRNNVLKESDIFILRKSWHEKFYHLMKKTYSGFVAVFFLPLIAFPFFLFINQGQKIYGFILSFIMLTTLVIYALLLQKIYGSSEKYHAE